MERIEKKVFFSTLWIIVSLNYLYCDVTGLMDVNLLKQFLKGSANGMTINEDFLLYAAMLMEIPIAMVILSRILKYKANRWANIIASILMTMVQTATLFAGSPTKYYLFWSFIEIATTVFIAWNALRWTKPVTENIEKGLNLKQEK